MPLPGIRIATIPNGQGPHLTSLIRPSAKHPGNLQCSQQPGSAMPPVGDLSALLSSVAGLEGSSARTSMEACSRSPHL